MDDPLSNSSIETVVEEETGETAGTFEIEDWKDYPSTAKPKGPFRILEGEEYDDARKLANRINANIHAQRPDLAGMQIHEMHPMKFGGSPTDIDNKIVLSPKEHTRYTAFWNRILREQQKGEQ